MLNKVELIGHLGADPEIRTTTNGDKVANLRIATSERYKDQGGQKQERTEWHTVTMWSKLADVAEKYLKKGAKVYLAGKLRTRRWEKDGEDRYSTEVVAGELLMLDKKADA